MNVVGGSAQSLRISGRRRAQALEGALRKKKAVALARAEAQRGAPDEAPGGRSRLRRWVASVLAPGGGGQAAGARIQALQDEARAPAGA